MKVISITGGIGSGKSEVLKILKEEFGAELIIADKIAHQLMEPGKKGYLRVVELLGTDILKSDGSIDRQKLSELIFKDKAFIEKIDEMIHPMAWKEIKYAINHSDKNTVVVEAALFDDEHNTMFDEIWYVYTEKELRIARMMDSRGYTREKCLEIMGNQASEDEYRQLADHVIDNNGTIKELCSQLKVLMKEEQ